MIINKRMEEIKGFITCHYSYDNKFNFGHRYEEPSQDELDSQYETLRFNSLVEFLTLVSPEGMMATVKEDMGADKVWISNISFEGKSEDTETKATISFPLHHPANGYVSTEVNNTDIESRVLPNLLKAKEIIDNALEQYPVLYKSNVMGTNFIKRDELR